MFHYHDHDHDGCGGGDGDGDGDGDDDCDGDGDDDGNGDGDGDADGDGDDDDDAREELTHTATVYPFNPSPLIKTSETVTSSTLTTASVEDICSIYMGLPHRSRL